MCGLCGIVATARNGQDLESVVARMAQTMDHRGPDDRGIERLDPAVCFGFRRLAILDLTRAGHQPMPSPSGRYTIVFNGEIYNFRDLRSELENESVRFGGRSDTEVLVAAIDRWGLRSTLPRLVGMFAMAVWDRETRAVHLVRDRLGIKPLYYALGPYGLAFASEMKAILRSGIHPLELDPDGLATFFSLLYTPAPGTIVKGVRKVAPGTMVRVESDRPSDPVAEAYWSLRDTALEAVETRRPMTLAEAADGLEERLLDAVRSRLVADVPLGTLLSGGIDSTTVTALAQESSATPIRTFSIGFDVPEHDESAHARQIADYLGTDHTELPVSARDALELVDQLAWLCDEPIADPSIIPTLQISTLARQSVTVALSGDGGDELFGGYNRYRYGQTLIPLLRRVPGRARTGMGKALRFLRSPLLDTGRTGDAGLLSRALGVRLPDEKLDKLIAMMESRDEVGMYLKLHSPWQSSPAPGQARQLRGFAEDLWQETEGWTLIDRMLLFDQLVYLPDDLLAKVDRASMATSLEARVPILDHRVVEYSWKLGPEMKIHRGRTKRVLREVLYRRVPHRLVDRPKVGFTVPIRTWLRGPLKPWADDLISSIPSDGPLDRTFVRTAWSDLLDGRSGSALGLWTVLVYLAWEREWLS